MTRSWVRRPNRCSTCTRLIPASFISAFFSRSHGYGRWACLPSQRNKTSVACCGNVDRRQRLSFSGVRMGLSSCAIWRLLAL